MSKASKSNVSMFERTAVVAELSTEWRQLSGVASQLLADLDRRRPKHVVPAEAEPKAA
jgi:hypothetical protein